jgi:hypothetical protein
MPTPQIPGFLRTLERGRLNRGIELGGVFVAASTGRNFFVRGDGTSPNYYNDQISQFTTQQDQETFASVATALTYCTAGRGDTIHVLPNHTENISSGTSWVPVANVKIVGYGVGTERPTFTFTAGASKITINVNGFGIENCRFLCAGPAGTTAITVAAPFAVTGNGVCLNGNYFQTGIDVDQFVQAFMAVSGTDFIFADNEMESLDAAAALVSGMILTGADRAKILNNSMYSGMAAVGTGLISFATTASRNVVVADNIVTNTTTNSTVCINLAAALANSGWMVRNQMKITLDSGVAPFGTIHASNLVALMDNFVVNVGGERGLVVGVASA